MKRRMSSPEELALIRTAEKFPPPTLNPDSKLPSSCPSSCTVSETGVAKTEFEGLLSSPSGYTALTANS